MVVLTPREVRQHTGECAAVTHLTRLDMWVKDDVDECPECGKAGMAQLPGGSSEEPRTWVAWHAAGAETVAFHSCGHEVSVEELIHEHGE